MTTEQNAQTADSQSVLKAKFRLGLCLMALFLPMMIYAAITFPFVGHTSKMQNVTYGILVSMPFWISLVIYIVLAYRDLSSSKEGHPV